MVIRAVKLNHRSGLPPSRVTCHPDPGPRGLSALAGHALPRQDTLPVGLGQRLLAQLCCRPGLRVGWGLALAHVPTTAGVPELRGRVCGPWGG